LRLNEAQGSARPCWPWAEPCPGPGYVQLLEPLGPDTPVGKFLARRGEGIHHIGYGVADIGEALSTLGVPASG
jgi:methylmalonyl-CoA/ethylmalonyl-CoA epimerase